jgi:hypothetical protein
LFYGETDVELTQNSAMLGYIYLDCKVANIDDI